MVANKISSFIICWGANADGVYVTPDGLDITYATTFSKLHQIVATRVTGANTTSSGYIYARNKTGSGFNAYLTSGSTNVNYVAIGK